MIQCSKCKQWFNPDDGTEVMKMTNFLSKEKGWKLCRPCLELWSETVWRPKIRNLIGDEYEKVFLAEAEDFIKGEQVLLT
jgi:hypothetical protein